MIYYQLFQINSICTSTSDSACGIPGSPFTISGIIGPEVQITMGGDKYAFQGTGDVTASNAKA